MGVVKRCVAGFLALSVVGAQAQQVSSPAFDRVAEQLQTGGNFYLVTTFEEAFEKAASQVSEYAALMASQQPLLAPMQERVTKVLSYLETTGLFAMDSFGLSTVPRADGDFDMRMFLGQRAVPIRRLCACSCPGRRVRLKRSGLSRRMPWWLWRIHRLWEMYGAS